jgi:hypothetical protein
MNTSDYRAMYTAMKDFHLAVDPETGTLLYMLARSMRLKGQLRGDPGTGPVQKREPRDT